MNTEQQQQAQHLYFQTDLTKTQIAELLNISRSSLHFWIRENNWDRLKKSAAHLPSLLAENCYHIIAHFTESLLSECRVMRPITHQEADTLHKLTLTVKKLKTQSTLNEAMEMFAFFMESVKAKSAGLAESITPHVNAFIASRASIHRHHMLPENFNDNGFLPVKEENVKETQLDIQDIMEWTETGTVVDIEQLRSMDEKTPASAPSQSKEVENLPSTPLTRESVMHHTQGAGSVDRAEVMQKADDICDQIARNKKFPGSARSKFEQ